MNEPNKDENDTGSRPGSAAGGAASAPLEAPAKEAQNANAAAAAGAPPEAPGAASAQEAQQAEIADLKDKLLRTLAEMENLRRRTEREVADAKTYGVTSFARDMLTFADNLRRILENLPASAREGAEQPWKGLVEGIEVTERDFHSRLAKYGIKKIEPLGAKFDPNLHEALFEIPSETAPAGTVVQVVEDGYAIGERVLRPAKVGVSRAGPKTANESAPA
ncbi:MAG TPA: nucleotide exchange factor GrpE [Methylocella sp.]|nr:nucleotide exchange factor GrpE [Methylocella sp.]